MSLFLAGKGEIGHHSVTNSTHADILVMSKIYNSISDGQNRYFP